MKIYLVHLSESSGRTPRDVAFLNRKDAIRYGCCCVVEFMSRSKEWSSIKKMIPKFRSAIKDARWQEAWRIWEASDHNEITVDCLDVFQDDVEECEDSEEHIERLLRMLE